MATMSASTGGRPGWAGAAHTGLPGGGSSGLERAADPPRTATAINGLADQEDLRLRFDVLTKTKKPELHRYWTTRDRAANLRLFRLLSEVLRAIEAGVFHPVVGWHCQDCPYRSRCWAWP